LLNQISLLQNNIMKNKRIRSFAAVLICIAPAVPTAYYILIALLKYGLNMPALSDASATLL